MKVFAALVLQLMTAFLQAAPAADLQVATNFPGGSAKVESIDQKTRTVQLMPGGPKERGWVCWWYFKLSGGTPGETIMLDVGHTAMAAPDQVFFSYDGRQWRQTAHCKRNGSRATYKQRIDQSEIYFAWGPPFVLSDAQALVKDAAARSEYVTAFELTKSREGRAVPGLRMSFPGESGDKRHGFWIQARQHAWECGSSWVCRGLVEWLLSEEPRAVRLRTASDFRIIPIMDVDSVEAGNGGKQQQPHDHARDWCDTPQWPEVAAAVKEIREMKAAGHFDGFVDLHNPAPKNRQPFFYVPPASLLSPASVQKRLRFLEAAHMEIRAPLQLADEPKETGPDYDPMWKQIGTVWIVENIDGDPLACTLETSWNTPHSTAEGYRQVGRQLGLALDRWLHDSLHHDKTVE